MRRLVIALACWTLAGCAPTTRVADASAPHVPLARFQRVDAQLYRGSQPDASGFRFLRDLGIRTVINLRLEADARETDERATVESLGMRYVNVPVPDGSFFTRSRTIPPDAIQTFFDVVDAPDTGPVFVHCRRGADRTGALIAFYRIARNGWDQVRAYNEARESGMRSWYTGLRKQIEAFDASLVARTR